MAEVSCETCPIRGVRELTWRRGLRPDVTAFDAATNVADEIIAVHEEVWGENGTSGLAESEEDVQDDDVWLDAPDDVELRAEDVAHSLHATILPLSDKIWQAVEGARPVADDIKATVTIIHAIGGCVSKQFDGSCSIGNLYEQTATVLSGLINRGMGAAVLHTIARHGSAEEVIRMASRVQDVLNDAFDRQDLVLLRDSWDLTGMHDATSRAYLMRAAEVLEQGLPRGN